MSDSISTLTLDDREQLVAYLDGELSAEESAQVEDRLSTDGQFRREMQRLARAWDVLDELPQPMAGEVFAKTTIDMVTVAVEEEVADAKSKIGRRRVGRSFWIAAALAAALLVGFVTARRIWPDPNRQLIADLPVIDQLDTLTQFRDVQFLRELSRKIGPRMDDLGGTEPPSDLADLQGLAAASRRERRRYIEELESDDAAALSAHLDRFRELDEAGQDRVRQHFHDIMAAPDADKLLATMLRYAAWLEDRSAGERATLRELSADERVERIGRMLENDRRTAMRRLSAEEQKALREVVVSYVGEHWHELVRAVPQRGRNRSRLERLRREDVSDRMKVFVSTRLLLEFRQNQHHLLALYQEARDALSEESRQYLDKLQPPRQGMQMRRWTTDAFKAPKITEQQLEQFFASDALSNDEREELLVMPWDEMRQTLRRRYYLEEYGVRWDDFEGGPRSPDAFRGGRRGNGPPRGPRGGPGRPRGFGPDGPPPDRRGPPPPGPPPDRPPPREEPRF